MFKLTGEVQAGFNRLAGIIFHMLKLKGDATVDIAVTDDASMRELNKTTRGVDGTTDVLSYPALDRIVDFTRKNYPNDYDEQQKAVVLGEIAINLDAAARQAEEYGTGAREVNYLFVHGMLHLLGYDHIDENDKAKMRELEEAALAEQDKSVVVAVVGRPNAGKSSIVNAIVGEKVSIVSPKPQTTRDRITGICTEGSRQIIFLLVVLDSTKGMTEADEKLITERLKCKAPLYIAVNKTDLKGYDGVYPILEKLNPLMTRGEGKSVKDVIPTSCKTGRNIDVLKAALFEECKDGGFLFPADEYTDRPVKFLIAETVREKALLFLQDEIPHGVGVSVRQVDESAQPIRISCDVIVDKQSHKQIAIGDGGEMIKRIGQSARRDIERMLGESVYLELFVKVRTGWRDRSDILKDIGY